MIAIQTKKPLVRLTGKGLYCPDGDFYIDPTRPVVRALITHAHADHARRGNRHYLAHEHTVPVLRQRLGTEISAQGLRYGETLNLNGVKVSLHPAGHIPGSAQVRLEKDGHVWVVSGDYKLENDGFSQPFEPVRCHTFVTESTFGLPLYAWPDQASVYHDINAWWRENQKQGKTTILLAYALGKAQRLIRNVDTSLGPVYAHGAVEELNRLFRAMGLDLPETPVPETGRTRKDFANALIIAPPSILGSAWIRRFAPYDVGFASGWMRLRGARRRKSVGRGFVVSDHADWNGLNRAVALSGAETVYALHGQDAVFARWLRSRGINAFDAEALERPEKEGVHP